MSRSSSTSTFWSLEKKKIKDEIEKVTEELNKYNEKTMPRVKLWNDKIDTIDVLNRDNNPPYYLLKKVTDDLDNMKDEMEEVRKMKKKYQDKIEALKRKKNNITVGGKKKNIRKTKKNNKKVILPKLRKIDKSMKKIHYKIKDPFSKRKLAIHDGVKMEAKKKNSTLKKAAVAKKGRFNILRIYRRYKKIDECKIITKDMKYMDKKYGLNNTKDICGKK